MNFKGIKNKILRFNRTFTEHWSSFVKTHPRYDTDYYQAEVSKMLTCGSEAGGFAIFQCLRCGEDERKVHFSCKGKACPQCGKRYARDCMIKIAARLYPGVGYRQIVLTLPEQLRRPFYNHPNQHKLYSKFMALAQPCLEELIPGLFKNTEYKAATIVFLHVIVAEGAFHPARKEWRAFNYLSLAPIRLLWQKVLLTMVVAEFVELSHVVDQLWMRSWLYYSQTRCLMVRYFPMLAINQSKNYCTSYSRKTAVTTLGID